MCRFESGLGHQYNQRLTCCLPHNLPSYLIFLVHWLWSIRQRQAWLPYRNGATCSGGLASDATVTHPDQDLHDQDPRGGLGSAGRVRNGPGHVRLTRRGRGHDLGRSPGALCSGDNPTQKFSAAKREPGRIKVLGGLAPRPPPRSSRRTAQISQPLSKAKPTNPRDWPAGGRGNAIRLDLALPLTPLQHGAHGQGQGVTDQSSGFS